MKVENIETARQLIYKRDVLQNVIEKSEQWRSGHFEFVEHCGGHADKVVIANFPELKEKMLKLIQEEKENIEKEIVKL